MKKVIVAAAILGVVLYARNKKKGSNNLGKSSIEFSNINNKAKTLDYSINAEGYLFKGSFNAYKIEPVVKENNGIKIEVKQDRAYNPIITIYKNGNLILTKTHTWAGVGINPSPNLEPIIFQSA